MSKGFWVVSKKNYLSFPWYLNSDAIRCCIWDSRIIVFLWVNCEIKGLHFLWMKEKNKVNVQSLLLIVQPNVVVKKYIIGIVKTWFHLIFSLKINTQGTDNNKDILVPEEGGTAYWPHFQIVPISSLVPIYQNHFSKKLFPFTRF